MHLKDLEKTALSMRRILDIAKNTKHSISNKGKSLGSGTNGMSPRGYMATMHAKKLNGAAVSKSLANGNTTQAATSALSGARKNIKLKNAVPSVKSNFPLTNEKTSLPLSRKIRRARIDAIKQRRGLGGTAPTPPPTSSPNLMSRAIVKQPNISRVAA